MGARVNRYACLTKQEYGVNGYVLQPLRREDIYLIMKWRNQQIDALRQKEPLTQDMQQRYYDNIICPTFQMAQPPQILFSFLFEARCVGYGGLVHIDWDSSRGEMSFLADTERATLPEVYERDFANFITLLKKAAFGDLTFHRINGETYDIRSHHVAIMEKNGFVLEGRLREHVKIGGRYVDSLLHGCLKRDC